MGWVVGWRSAGRAGQDRAGAKGQQSGQRLGPGNGKGPSNTPESTLQRIRLLAQCTVTVASPASVYRTDGTSGSHGASPSTALTDTLDSDTYPYAFLGRCRTATTLPSATSRSTSQASWPLRTRCSTPNAKMPGRGRASWETASVEEHQRLSIQTAFSQSTTYL